MAEEPKGLICGGRKGCCADLRQLQELFRNRVEILVCLAGRYQYVVEDKKREIYLTAIDLLKSEIESDLGQLERICKIRRNG